VQLQTECSYSVCSSDFKIEVMNLCFIHELHYACGIYDTRENLRNEVFSKKKVSCGINSLSHSLILDNSHYMFKQRKDTNIKSILSFTPFKD